jgi:hypothetical protein
MMIKMLLRAWQDTEAKVEQNAAMRTIQFREAGMFIFFPKCKCFFSDSLLGFLLKRMIYNCTA